MRVRPLICLDAPVPRLISIPRFDALAGPRASSSSFQITRGLAAFSFDALCPVRLLNHGGRGKVFFFMRALSAVSWLKRRGLWMASIQSALSMPSRFSLPHASVPLRVRRVPLPFRLRTSSMMSCPHRILCRLYPPPSLIPAPSSVYHAGSLRLLARFALSPRLSSLRLTPRLSCR